MIEIIIDTLVINYMYEVTYIGLFTYLESPMMGSEVNMGWTALLYTDQCESNSIVPFYTLNTCLI